MITFLSEQNLFASNFPGAARRRWTAARGRRKKREPGRGHYDKDRPAIIAWVSRQGGVVVQAARDFTVKTVQKAADIAVTTGSRLYTDSARSYRALTGSVHDFVNHTKKEYARGDVHRPLPVGLKRASLSGTWTILTFYKLREIERNANASPEETC
jgi:hypothetical protein